MQSTRKLRCLVLAGLMALGTYGLSTTALAADAGLHVDQVGYLTNHTKEDGQDRLRGQTDCGKIRCQFGREYPPCRFYEFQYPR